MRKLKRNPNFTKLEINKRFDYSRYLLDLLKEYNSKVHKYEKYTSEKENNLAVDASESIAKLINSLRLE